MNKCFMKKLFLIIKQKSNYIQTWKIRWFVMNKKELKYYEEPAVSNNTFHSNIIKNLIGTYFFTKFQSIKLTFF